MLTFPLPARIKTLARDTEHDHTPTSTDFILKSIFPSGLWTLDLVQVRMMTTQRKVLGRSEQMPPAPRITEGGTPPHQPFRPCLLVAVGLRLTVRDR